jgi:hypothetical protein
MRRMRGREESPGRGRRRVIALSLVALVSVGALAPAVDAKKKKKKKSAAVTRSAAVPFAQGSNASVTAACPKGTHVTGGGFVVSPNFDPGTTTGLRSMNSTSHPSGKKTWTSGGSAYSTPSASGTFTGFARCEKDSAGKLAVTANSTATVSPGAGQNMAFNCPPGTHVISGGYAGQSLGAFNFAIASARIVVLGSRRTGPGQWTISAYNNSSAPASATLTGYASCELNGKGQAVSEASAFAPVVDNGRTVADATCSKKKHVVAGGFLVSPATFPGDVPFIGVDESQPTGSRGWHVGLHEFPPFTLPPGSSLQATAYCKNGK